MPKSNYFMRSRCHGCRRVIGQSVQLDEDQFHRYLERIDQGNPDYELSKDSRTVTVWTTCSDCVEAIDPEWFVH